MKKFLNHLWKVIVMTIVYFIVNMISGLLLPLSNNMMAAMTPEDQASFMPLFLLNIFINMNANYLLLKNLRYRGWKLFLFVWLSAFGIFALLNNIELYWYNEAFPLYSFMDVHKLNAIALTSYGLSTLVGVCLAGGFKREEKESGVEFIVGKGGWRIVFFCAAYSLIYYAFGFLPWTFFPEVREFYAGWALTTEPIPVLLLFNVFRGLLWFLSSLPILTGVCSRGQACWLLPMMLFCGTAVATIIPSAVMPARVRLAHFIELASSMTLIGLFMVWVFIRPNGKVKSGK